MNFMDFYSFSNAEICVVLCNQGLEAIDIERFGRSITILRKISIKGASRYFIKNEYGKFFVFSCLTKRIT